MFLHIGDDLVLWEKDIVGIFDFETASLSNDTKEYLRSRERNKEINANLNQIPKSFVVVNKKKSKKKKVYYTIISTRTLNKRIENKLIVE